jgi:membrane fusion protein, copper/silver efflux system
MPANRMPAGKRRWWPWIMLILLAAGGALYWFYGPRGGSGIGQWLGLKSTAKAEEVWYCPMHPNYKSNKPGECPICHMTLVKLEPEAGGPGGAPGGPATAAPGEPETTGRAEPAKPAAAGAQSGPAPAASGERRILYWQDAMNPSHHYDKPGKAPDGMDLVPVYAAAPPPAGQLPPGSVRISPEKQQLIGVAYGEAVEGPLVKTVRTVGRVTYDETRISRIQPKIDGWIDKVYVDFAGKLVRKNQPLISIYSPDLVSTQQEFLVSSRARESLRQSPIPEIASGAQSLYESARQRLRLWDISEAQINEIEKRGEPTRTLTLYSPVAGFVLTRNAFDKQRVTTDTELYTIADLSAVWVLADVYEYEVPLIRLGQTATISLSYSPGETFAARVSYIYPQVEATSRTLKIRLELPNPDFRLKPDMYADVALRIDYGTHVSVPQEAVLDGGLQQIVFVAREGGLLEPRRVEAGARLDGRIIILSGLQAGEKVVTSGNFLVDSESQLKAALGSAPGPASTSGEGSAAGMGSMPDMEDGGQAGMSGTGATSSPSGTGSSSGMESMPMPSMDHSQHAR